MNKVISYTLATIAMLLIGFLFGLAADYGLAKEEAYENAKARHVLSVWGDGKDHPDHTCEYGPEWCNPHYCETLRKSAK